MWIKHQIPLCLYLHLQKGPQGLGVHGTTPYHLLRARLWVATMYAHETQFCGGFAAICGACCYSFVPEIQLYTQVYGYILFSATKIASSTLKSGSLTNETVRFRVYCGSRVNFLGIYVEGVIFQLLVLETTVKMCMSSFVSLAYM